MVHFISRSSLFFQHGYAKSERNNSLDQPKAIYCALGRSKILSPSESLSKAVVIQSVQNSQIQPHDAPYQDHPQHHHTYETIPVSVLYLLFVLGVPLFTRLASGRVRWFAGIQEASKAFAPVVTAGPSAPTTATCSAGSTRLLPFEDVLARSPPFPPRRVWGKRVLIQVR
jgi:hypothetical protein